jgi:hypothetical protein
MIGLVSNARVVGRRQGRIGIVEAGKQEEAKYKTTNSQSKRIKTSRSKVARLWGAMSFACFLDDSWDVHVPLAVRSIRTQDNDACPSYISCCRCVSEGKELEENKEEQEGGEGDGNCRGEEDGEVELKKERNRKPLDDFAVCVFFALCAPTSPCAVRLDRAEY